MDPIVFQLVELDGMPEGMAILSVGLLGLLLWAVVKFRNPAGMIMWCLSVLMLMAGGIYELGSDIFWLSIMMTVIVITIGVSVRMIR